MSAFKDVFRNLRKSNNLTQVELASKLGVAQSTINGWETGSRMPSSDTLKHIANFFDTSIDNLLGYTQAYGRVYKNNSDQLTTEEVIKVGATKLADKSNKDLISSGYGTGKAHSDFMKAYKEYTAVWDAEDKHGLHEYTIELQKDLKLSETSMNKLLDYYRMLLQVEKKTDKNS